MYQMPYFDAQETLRHSCFNSDDKTLTRRVSTFLSLYSRVE